MLISILLRLIDLFTTALVLLVLTYVVISYFMSPYHTFRMWVNRLVEPMLQPIRKVVPLIGMFDISPIILLLLIQFVSYILKQILVAFIL
ncbi:MAG: YggT family protein [Anaerolineales bacterium]|jgi:YggT family protein